ncbi:hypothetical protein PtrSN002B_001950 [Pyrenophora tritici-repentis]|uniref:Uncharacterized protein n=2 Tax=Pyrenophora tritici-repentis TaxID=45151 RepID=A0A2W1HWN5_9PLEO|nr:hypothetical protein PtrV1_05776 [Pyrenophora tritici-repentis]KAF7450509.1 hypothetical protein A1F99_051250 [Pyrenophora tritici-repentis]KAG9381271.1 hypothetical protein A1F94_008591 [Pyrenophora tritici-repentis]KAI0584216.1 hypothetical protein Alg215_03177 [Pyrenophora tritici-repentis]KAI0584721.1 hypothetical protein Alg130_05097 [Pyrenophora tritici-repentis]
MNSPKPIDPQWLSDTLTPYLRYAFSHALRSNARIKPYIQRAANACKNNLNTPGQDSDAQFEHVLQTVERRCRGLPVQTNVITDNLEALAQFLIGRAQVKGPYELPDLGTPGGGDRFGAFLASLPPKPVLGDKLIDPRLCSALPGQFASSELSGTLSKAEDQFYRRKDRRRKNLFTMPPSTTPQSPSTVEKPRATPGSLEPRDNQQRQASFPQPGHQQSHKPIFQPGPQQGFGVLIPREQPTAYNDIMSGRAAVNPVQSRHDQAQAGSLDTSKRPAHTNTSAPRQQEASTSTSGPSPHPPQTNESVSQQQNPSHAILSQPPALLSQPLQPQQVTAPTAPNPPHQSESTTIPDILLWSTSAELEAEMAAFRNLPRAEKMAKLTKILSSLQAKHAEKVLPPKSVSRERRTSVGRSRVTRYEMRKRQDAAMR